MEQEITYKVTAKELRELLLEPIRNEVRAEFRAKFNNKVIDVETVAKIHGVHPHTVRTYAKSGDLIHEDRNEKEEYKFKLGDALEFDFRELRRQLKNHKL
jgi:hypothetical protein